MWGESNPMKIDKIKTANLFIKHLRLLKIQISINIYK
jgi:hypothetical protein